jgi:hypothetical protein
MDEKSSLDKIDSLIRAGGSAFVDLAGEDDIRPHCSDPYDCDFMGHCWKHIPEGKTIFV